MNQNYEKKTKFNCKSDCDFVNLADTITIYLKIIKLLSLLKLRTVSKTRLVDQLLTFWVFTNPF